MSLRLALVGLGEIHETHAAALRSVSDVEVVAAYDPRESAQCEVAGLERIPTFPALLARDDLDAALVAVPTTAHAAVATDLLKAGFDVLLEKPVAVTLDDLDALYATADEHGRVCYSALHDSVGDEVVHLRRELLEGLRPELGRLIRIRCEYQDPYGAEQETRARRHSMAGSWLDSGSNALSVVALFVTDLRPVDVTLTLDTPEAPLIEDREATVRLVGREAVAPGALGGEVEVEILTTWLRPRRSKATTLVYERGQIELEHADRTISIVEAGGSRRTIDLASGVPRMVTQYVRVFEEFAAACRARRDNRTAAYAVHRPLLQVYESDLPLTIRTD